MVIVFDEALGIGCVVGKASDSGVGGFVRGGEEIKGLRGIGEESAFAIEEAKLDGHGPTRARIQRAWLERSLS